VKPATQDRPLPLHWKMRTINVTAVTSNEQIILNQDADIIFLQETSADGAPAAAFKTGARDRKW